MSVSNNINSDCNDTEGCSSDIKEQLSLHVRKRLFEEAQEEGTSLVVDVDRDKRKLKKTKKKKCTSAKHKKKKRVNVDTPPEEKLLVHECGAEDLFDCKQNGIHDANSDSEDTSIENSPFQDVTSPILTANPRGESFLNNSILNQILSEKKRELLESPELIEFLQSRMKTPTPTYILGI